jgi:hypothetical protein
MGAVLPAFLKISLQIAKLQGDPPARRFRLSLHPQPRSQVSRSEDLSRESRSEPARQLEHLGHIRDLAGGIDGKRLARWPIARAKKSPA